LYGENVAFDLSDTSGINYLYLSGTTDERLVDEMAYASEDETVISVGAEV
jgi:hypothetical protein